MQHRHEYPQWQPQDLTRLFPDLEPAGIDLLKQCLHYDNSKRISVCHTIQSALAELVKGLNECTCVLEDHSVWAHIVLAMLQAKEAMNHPYFDDLDKRTIDAMENDNIL